MMCTLRQRRCSLLELLILAILTSEGNLHGYALYKRIMEITRMQWKPSIGTIYRLLNNMAERGLVSKNVENRKHSYSITAKGLEYFTENSKIPLIRKAGVLATILEAYFMIAEEKADIITDDLKERLRILNNILEKHRDLVE